MDVSHDRYELREPTPEVEHVDNDLVEHKKLCSEATLGNQDDLRAFDARQDGDLLRTRSVDWIQEGFSNMKEAQEIRRQEYYRTEAEKAKEGEQYEPVADESIFS
jgi:hypothetical protein